MTDASVRAGIRSLQVDRQCFSVSSISAASTLPFSWVMARSMADWLYVAGSTSSSRTVSQRSTFTPPLYSAVVASRVRTMTPETDPVTGVLVFRSVLLASFAAAPMSESRRVDSVFWQMASSAAWASGVLIFRVEPPLW